MQEIEKIKGQISSALRQKLEAEGLRGNVAVVISCTGAPGANDLASQLVGQGARVYRVLRLTDAVAVELSMLALIQTLTKYPRTRAELDEPGELE